MEDAVMPYNPENTVQEEVQTAFEEKYLSHSGVVGVGLSNTDIGDDTIVVYIRSSDALEGLPSVFQGVPVVVEIVGDIEAQ